MGQPKSKRTAMLDPRHRAKLLKEKYRQQLAERREPESDSAEIQAVDEVEDTANWAVDTVQDRAAQVPRAREKPPIKEKSAASIPRERKANEQTAASREPPARYTVPKNKNFLETSSAEEARPLDEKQQFEARRQFVADKQKSKLLSERRGIHSVDLECKFWGLGGDGTAIEGLYHLAGEFCPRQADEGAGVTEGTVKTIGILDYSRESVGGAAAKDSSYLYSFLEAQGTCDVHTTAPQPQEPEEYDPNSFVISDPSTWPPVNDPRYENFDPENPATWPNAGQPSETPSPGESGQPNPPETSTSPTPSPVPTPVETPPDEPYIPADGTK